MSGGEEEEEEETRRNAYDERREQENALVNNVWKDKCHGVFEGHRQNVNAESGKPRSEVYTGDYKSGELNLGKRSVLRKASRKGLQALAVS